MSLLGGLAALETNLAATEAALSPLASQVSRLYGKYGSGAGKAASTIERAFANYKARKAGVSGRSKFRSQRMKDRMAPESGPATRQRAEDAIVASGPLRTLVISEFTYPEQGSDFGQRLGATIDLRGIKLCEQFHNDQAYPIVVHWALLQPKTEDPVVNLNFFRDASEPTTRSKNFTNTPTSSTAPYEFYYDCYPINPDKFYILDHKKRVLAAENTDVKWDWDTWKFEKYYKINKRFTFQTSTSDQPTKPLYRVYWWQPLRAGDWVDPTPAELPTITRQHHAVMYFKPNTV